MAKILEIEGCKNTNCSSWKGECKRAVAYRVGEKLGISMITERHNKVKCELFLPRRFEDVKNNSTTTV